jgi:hypothetical protein
VTLTDDALADRASTIIGFNQAAPSQVCAECHSPNALTLRDWQGKTTEAVATCLKDADATGEVINTTSGNIRVDNHEFKGVAQYDVAAGSFLEVSITGTGDIDLYVKRGSEPTKESYDCRPFAQTSTERCDKSTFNAAGPATFYVGLNGTADGSVKVTAKYTKPPVGVMKAADRVACFRLEAARADSPYTPAKLGIYAAGAHLGWFQDTFKAAFPADVGSNNADTWALEYGRFKNRASMPKGNHPRFTQEEFDVVAEWFARGLPRMSSYLAPDTGPTSCTPLITSAVGQHQATMATQGWGALNRQAGLNMYGCAGTTDPTRCLASMPLASSKPYGSGWQKTGNLRVLRELAFKGPVQQRELVLY